MLVKISLSPCPYIVDNKGDVVTELSNRGTDKVQSSFTHTLSANVENLTLKGTATINGTGNSLGNRIAGNSAANIIKGGAGNDSLTGGTGNDSFVFNSKNEGVDLLTDFASAPDTIIPRGIRHHQHHGGETGN